MQNKTDWNDYLFFFRIAECGSLKKAAEDLGVNTTTVFRRINGLEKNLGTRLFERMKTGYLLTDAGKSVLGHVKMMEKESNSMLRQLQGMDNELQGVLKISTTDTIGFYWLPPYLKSFTEEYPEISIDLKIDNNFTDLDAREADVVIPAINRQSARMIGRKLAPIVMKLCASRGYIAKYGAPVTTDDLKGHSFILPDEEIGGIRANLWLRKHIDESRIVFSSNKLTGLHQLARQGRGITLLPMHVIRTDPEMNILLDLPKSLNQDIWILTHPDYRKVIRVRTFMRYMNEATKTLRETTR